MDLINFQPESELSVQLGVDTMFDSTPWARESPMGASSVWMSIFDATKDSIIVLDDKFRVVMANAATSKMLDLPPEQILGKKCWQLVHGIQEAPESCPLIHADGTGIHKESEMFLTDRGIWAEISTSHILNDKGEIAGIVHVLRDITNRKKSEKALQESEKLFKMTIEGSNVAICLLDPGGVPVIANEAFEKMTGSTSEELLELDFTRYTHPDDLEREILLYKELVYGKRDSYAIEKRNIRKDGGHVWLRLNVTAVRGDQDEINYLIAVGEDITERKKTEESLRREKDKARLYLDLAGVMFVALNAKGEVTLVNKKSCEILGYEQEEIINRNWFDNFLPASSKDQVWTVFEQLVRGKIDLAEYFENPILTKSNEQRIIAWHNTVLRDEEGNITGILSSGQDITDRKKVEKRLQEESAARNVLLDNLPCIAMVLKKETREIVTSNRMAQEVGAVPGETCYKTCAKRDYPCPFCRAPEVWKTNESRRLEVEYKGRYYEGIWSPLTKDLYVHYIFDITERKKTEDRLSGYQAKLKDMASRILHAEDDERRRIAIGIHDNICQKLVVSKMALDSSLKLISDANVTTSLKIVSESIGDTIEEAASLTFDLSSPILHELGLVAAIGEYLKREIHNKYGIEVELESDDQLGNLTEQAKNLLFRISRELLVNVVKHARARKVKVSVHENDGCLRLSIEDNGVGFKKEDISKVARFGLFSIQEQLEHFRGQLEIESESGNGTKATAVVPLKELSTE